VPTKLVGSTLSVGRPGSARSDESHPNTEPRAHVICSKVRRELARLVSSLNSWPNRGGRRRRIMQIAAASSPMAAVLGVRVLLLLGDSERHRPGPFAGRI
jgi:hypothetical protein